ncbi:MAG TPA: hypothetical protein VH120_08345 [Gemmataceae bacterium]|nr:hypothetical protein [Gemmataceae bacterium]
MTRRRFWTLLVAAGCFAVGPGCGSKDKPQFEVKGGSGPTAHERPLQPLDNTAPKGGTPKPKGVE